MKRYTVVKDNIAAYGGLLEEVDSLNAGIFVEYYWADDLSHAEEQAKNSSGEYDEIVIITCDPVQADR